MRNSQFYKKLVRKDNFSLVCHLKSKIPTLKSIDRDELEEALNDFIVFQEERKPAKWYMRLLLPVTVIVWIICFLGLPFNFMVTGVWGYNSERLENFFRQTL